MNAIELLAKSVEDLPGEAKDGPWQPIGRQGTLVGILVNPDRPRGPGSVLADCRSDGEDLAGDMAITGHVCLMGDPQVATALADLLERFHELRAFSPALSELDGQVGYLEHLLVAKIK